MGWLSRTARSFLPLACHAAVSPDQASPSATFSLPRRYPPFYDDDPLATYRKILKVGCGAWEGAATSRGATSSLGIWPPSISQACGRLGRLGDMAALAPPLLCRAPSPSPPTSRSRPGTSSASCCRQEARFDGCPAVMDGSRVLGTLGGTPPVHAGWQCMPANLCDPRQLTQHACRSLALTLRWTSASGTAAWQAA